MREREKVSSEGGRERKFLVKEGEKKFLVKDSEKVTFSKRGTDGMKI